MTVHLTPTDPPSPTHRVWRRAGIVLALVLVVIAVLALAAYAFTELMITHRAGASVSGRQLQTKMFVDSGVATLRTFLMQDAETIAASGGLFDNPTLFQAIPVLSAEQDVTERGNFTILAPRLDDEGTPMGVRYGLEDESAKLNLNLLLLADTVVTDGGRALLMSVPGMTEDVADAILDWLDEDDEPREYGAEADYYMGLNPPYAPANGPPTTLTELLLVRGVTPTLLFGKDMNRNGVVDPHEMNNELLNEATSSVQLETDTTGLGSLDRGWAGYLTLHSAESNFSATGSPRINLNRTDLEILYEELAEVLGEELAAFIIAYRQQGPYDGDEEGQPGPVPNIDVTQPGQHNISQVLELIGAKIQVGGQEGDVIQSPFSSEPTEMASYLPLLMDNCSTTAAFSIPGRLNINLAPRALLLGIPNITEELVDAIIDARSIETDDGTSDELYRHETWLLATGLVTMEEMRNLLPFITAGGDVFRAQIVGYYENGGIASRGEVLIDASGLLPRILSFKDISHLGRGYPLEVLGMQLGGSF